MKKHLYFTIGLMLLSWFFFFHGLGSYKLIDIDETRYINIAQNMYNSGNYITPFLNFEPFLEKPPLFYWLTILSYKLFNGFSDFASRFPIALLAVIGVFSTYAFTFHIIKSRCAAFLSAVILMSSFWYAFFAHIAILDSGFTVFVTLAFYCGVSTLFCKSERAKMLLWYGGYVFLGLSVLQKGLIGIILPGVSLFLIFLALRRVKEIFTPRYIIPGTIMLLIVCAPWHASVFKQNGMEWFNEYIVKHHFARFFNSSMGIGRSQPFWWYIPIILGGFMPWTIFLVSAAIKAAQVFHFVVRSAKSFMPLLSYDTNDRALILINLIWFLTVFLFFSASSTKLPAYILPAFPSIAILTGYFWWGYLSEGKNKKYIEISSLITLLIFLSAGIFGCRYYLSGGINIGFTLVCLFVIFSVLGLIFLAKGKRIWLFGSLMAFSFALFALSSPQFFNYVASFGQNELEGYSKMAAMDENAALVTFGFARKYSMLYFYRKKPVYFIPNIDKKYEILERTLQDLYGLPVYIVVENNVKFPAKYLQRFVLLKSGKKYSLFKSVK